MYMVYVNDLVICNKILMFIFCKRDNELLFNEIELIVIDIFYFRDCRYLFYFNFK